VTYLRFFSFITKWSKFLELFNPIKIVVTSRRWKLLNDYVLRVKLPNMKWFCGVRKQPMQAYTDVVRHTYKLSKIMIKQETIQLSLTWCSFSLVQTLEYVQFKTTPSIHYLLRIAFEWLTLHFKYSYFAMEMHFIMNIHRLFLFHDM
jgi:hypothetical protein